MLNNDKPKKPNKKGNSNFDHEAFKYAIGMVESSGGKYLTNPNSSASGKYHFLWKYLHDDPLLKGMSQREFISSPELQEEIMDHAINGKLKNYRSYSNYSKSLKDKYKSDLSQESIAALTHFMGAGGVNEYLKNKQYKVPGKVNLTAEQYADKFKRYMEAYSDQNTSSNNKPSDEYIGPQVDSAEFIKKTAAEASRKKIDNTRVENSMKGGFNPPKRRVTPNNMPNQSVDDFNADFNPPERRVTPNYFEQGGSFYENNYFKKGGMIKRADGSYSKRGLWDNIRANRGSGKKPTKAMLAQERKINKMAEGGQLSCGGPGQPPCDENYFKQIRESRGGEETYVINDGGKNTFHKNPQYKNHEPSTHLMSDDGKNHAWPSIRINSEGNWEDQSEMQAKQNNEYYTFKNEEEARNFARKGSWKGNKKEEGGELNLDAGELVTKFESGGTHEQNPLGGIPQGVGPNGKVNLVEEGETKWNDYIFSNSLGLNGKTN